MPTKAPNPLVAQAVFNYLVNGAPEVNTLWLIKQDLTDWETGDCDAAGAALFEWYETNLQAIQSTFCRLVDIKVTQWIFGSAATGGQPGDATSVGTVVGDLLPLNCTLCISFRTGLTGAGNRGRNYSVGMVESQQANGYAATAYVNALRAAYTALRTDLQSDGQFTWVAYSQVVDGETLPTGSYTPIRSVLVTDDRMDSQRRRKPL